MVVDGGQGHFNPGVAFRNLTNHDAAAMIILLDQILLMPNKRRWVKELDSKIGLSSNNTIETIVIIGGQGCVNPSVAIVFRNLTDNDAVAMIIWTDQNFVMPRRNLGKRT